MYTSCESGNTLDSKSLRLACLQLVVRRGQGLEEVLSEAKTYEKFILENVEPETVSNAPTVKADKKAVIIGKKSGNSDILS